MKIDRNKTVALQMLWHDAAVREEHLRDIVSEHLDANPPPRLDDAIVATYFFAFRTMKLEKGIAEISYHATSGIKHPPARFVARSMLGQTRRRRYV